MKKIDQLLAHKILNLVPSGVIIAHLEEAGSMESLRIIEVNRASAEMNGIPVEESVGKTIKEVYPAVFEEYPALVQAYRDAIDFKTTNLGVIPYGDGSVESSFFRCTIGPVEQDIIFILYDNVSQEEAARIKLEEKISELEVITDSMANRELKMIELKDRIKELEANA